MRSSMLSDLIRTSQMTRSLPAANLNKRTPELDLGLLSPSVVPNTGGDGINETVSCPPHVNKSVMLVAFALTAVVILLTPGITSSRPSALLRSLPQSDTPLVSTVASPMVTPSTIPTLPSTFTLTTGSSRTSSHHVLRTPAGPTSGSVPQSVRPHPTALRSLLTMADAVTFVPGDLTVRQAGLRLSTGLQAQVIATAGQRVVYANGERSAKKFHAKPDFGAVFPRRDSGGWIYVSNSEVENNGGVGALTFNQKGKIVDYKMLLTGTSMNCGGGPTPWGTWISCEETKGGRNWQVDPTGERSPRRISVGNDGGGRFESFAYDKVKGEYFVTEDYEFGPLRRWIPSGGYNSADPWLTLHGAGETTYLRLIPESSSGGTYEWVSNKKRASNNANTFYPNAEGIDVYGRRLYFVCKEIKTLFVLNLNNMRYSSHSTRKGLFDGEPDQLVSVLNDKNNEELLYFTEDGGKKLAGVHARNKQGRFYCVLESDGSIANDETTGLAFSPDFRFLYVAYQKVGKLFAVSRQDGLPFTAKSLNVKYHSTDAT